MDIDPRLLDESWSQFALHEPHIGVEFVLPDLQQAPTQPSPLVTPRKRGRSCIIKLPSSENSSSAYNMLH
jgi:hypothetical protein